LIENISAVMIAKDAAKTLPKVLESLKDFKEVIIYENNSSDNTVEIAKSYKNVKLHQGEFLGFGKTKNKAISLASNSWVLSLDSDEVLSKEFVDELKKLKLDDKKVYKIHRKNYYKDSIVKHCWRDDFIVRLFNKEKTSFLDKDVHEKVITDGFEVELLKGEVKHYPYSSIEEFIKKADTYSTLFAKNQAGKKSSSPFKAFANATYSFFRTYVIKRGFLDGYVGLVIAVSHAMTNFYKYIKLYELNLEQKNKKD